MSIAIVKHRIRKLFSEADETFSTNKKLADRYIELARKIGMKMNVRLPKKFKRKFCKHCNHYLKPGVNSRVRIHKHRVTIYCMDCKNFTRIPIKPKRS